MKRLITILLALAMLLAMVACAPANDADSDTGDVSKDTSNTDNADADNTDSTISDASDGEVTDDDLVVYEGQVKADESVYEFEKVAPVEPIKIGITLMDHTSNVCIDELEALRAYAKELGNIEIIEQDGKSDANSTVTAVENFVNAGCDIILMHNAYEGVLEDVIAEAVSAGVVVGCLDGVDPSAQVNFGTSTKVTGGLIAQNAADYINDNLGGKAKFAIVGLDEKPIYKLRADAIEEKIMELCPGSELVVRDSASNTTESYNLGEMWLQSHPEIEVVIGIADICATGISQVFTEAGKADEVKVFASDFDSAAKDQFSKDTCYEGTIFYNMPRMFVSMMQRCIDYYNAAAAGENVESKVYSMSPEGEFVRRANYEDFLDAPAF